MADFFLTDIPSGEVFTGSSGFDTLDVSAVNARLSVLVTSGVILGNPDATFTEIDRFVGNVQNTRFFCRS